MPKYIPPARRRRQELLAQQNAERLKFLRKCLIKTQEPDRDFPNLIREIDQLILSDEKIPDDDGTIGGVVKIMGHI